MMPAIPLDNTHQLKDILDSYLMEIHMQFNSVQKRERSTCNLIHQCAQQKDRRKSNIDATKAEINSCFQGIYRLLQKEQDQLMQELDHLLSKHDSDNVKSIATLTHLINQQKESLQSDLMRYRSNGASLNIDGIRDAFDIFKKSYNSCMASIHFKSNANVRDAKIDHSALQQIKTAIPSLWQLSTANKQQNLNADDAKSNEPEMPLKALSSCSSQQHDVMHIDALKEEQLPPPSHHTDDAKSKEEQLQKQQLQKLANFLTMDRNGDMRWTKVTNKRSGKKNWCPVLKREGFLIDSRGTRIEFATGKYAEGFHQTPYFSGFDEFRVCLDKLRGGYTKWIRTQDVESSRLANNPIVTQPTTTVTTQPTDRSEQLGMCLLDTIPGLTESELGIMERCEGKFDVDELLKSGRAMTSVHYDVMQLIDLQARFLDIEWRQHRDIPFGVRLVSKGVKPERYMKDVVAMFKRKSKNPWLAASHTGTAPTDEAERLVKRLTGVLNKMTPEKFDKVAKMSMDIVDEFANTQDQMEVIIGLVLQCGIKQPVFGSQYAELCKHLFDHLHKIALVCDHKWVQEDPNLADTLRRMVIQQTNELFRKHRNHSPDDLHLNAAGQRITDDLHLMRGWPTHASHRAFFAILVLIAELYNVGLLKQSLVYRGVFDELLKSGRVTSVDIEGLCRVFKHCGPKLDRVAPKSVGKYLHKLSAQARKFDFRTKVLVEEVQEMRSNHWQARLKKETGSLFMRELQSSRKGSPSRYGTDNDNGGGGGGGRYVLSPSKSNSNDSHSLSKTSKIETRLRNYIDAYLQGGDAQDIVALNCTDIKVWSNLIFDHLMELKPKEVDYFIGLVRDLFDHGTLSNKGNRFVVNVVQLLAEQFDHAMTDCPKFDVYVAKLCTTLCVHGHLSIAECFSSFIKVYQQNSGYPIGNQNKKIKKLVDRSVDEATRLKASRGFINKLSKVR